MKKTVLLSISEDPIIQMQIDLHLEGIADVILHAFTAESGLNIAVEQQPDLILLSDCCSVDDSCDVLCALKDTAQTRDIPVILFAESDRSGLALSPEKAGEVTPGDFLAAAETALMKNPGKAGGRLVVRKLPPGR